MAVMGFRDPAPQQDNSFLQKLLMGLTGTPPNSAAVDPQVQQAARQQALMAMGAQLLAGSGPSPVRQSFGSVLGPALMAGQQANQQGIDSALQTQLLMSQIQKNKQAQQKRKLTTVGAGGAVLDEDGNVVYSNPAKPNDGPSNVQEWEYYNKLSPEDQKRFLEMKRNQNALQLVDVAGGKSVFNKASGAIAPVTTAEQEAAAAGQIASGTAAGRATGEAQATAKLDLPRVETNANYAIDILDKIKNHPGLNYGVGLWSKAPVIPGTPQADFVALTEQLQGRQFLEAFNSLKGGGQISEIEGTKAENAIARMQRAQSKQAFIDAATEFQGIIRMGVENARKRAGGGAPPAAARSREDILRQYGITKRP